ncbi:MAG: hypothetical protein KF718_13730 [Polyangiaceae bacterium]|nr:hypothetical protein [Polyangiaceae bacterium]
MGDDQRGHRGGNDQHGHQRGHDQRQRGNDQQQRGPRPGGGDTEFLDLEISELLLGQAHRMAREVALELMRESMRERLRERLGARLAEVGRLAADELADDVEANLAIEAQIASRRARRGDLKQRLERAFSHQPAPARAGAAKKRR